MPVIFDEVVAEVVPDRAASSEESGGKPARPREAEDLVVRRELRRLARRAARLHAD
jgi:hypothetical protein